MNISSLHDQSTHWLLWHADLQLLVQFTIFTALTKCSDLLEILVKYCYFFTPTVCNDNFIIWSSGNILKTAKLLLPSIMSDQLTMFLFNLSMVSQWCCHSKTQYTRSLTVLYSYIYCTRKDGRRILLWWFRSPNKWTLIGSYIKLTDEIRVGSYFSNF